MSEKEPNINKGKVNIKPFSPFEFRLSEKNAKELAPLFKDFSRPVQINGYYFYPNINPQGSYIILALDKEEIIENDEIENLIRYGYISQPVTILPYDEQKVKELEKGKPKRRLAVVINGQIQKNTLQYYYNYAKLAKEFAGKGKGKETGGGGSSATG